MFKFTVTSYNLIKYYNILYDEDFKIPFALHTDDEELFRLIKQISIISVDKLNHYSLPIKKIKQRIDNNNTFADGVEITISVDNEEIGLYIRMKYFT